MTFTKFHHLTDDELTRLVSTSESSQLEIELAQRLEEEIEENKWLAKHNAAMRAWRGN